MFQQLIRQFIKNAGMDGGWGASLSHFCYPAFCLHCKERLPPCDPYLCLECSSQLEWLKGEERCKRCFHLIKSPLQGCLICRQAPTLFWRQAAVFEHIGPACTLVNKFKNGRSFLAKGLGAFLCVQFHQLEWTKPDAIIPVPLSFFHSMRRGYNQSALLAEELGKLLHVPVIYALRKELGHFSQTRLAMEQRKKMGPAFKLKAQKKIRDQHVLLIDDMAGSGMTLQRCAEALAGGYPATISGLTITKFLSD